MSLEFISPNDALARIAEYQCQHGLTAFTVRSTVKQRIQLLGDVVVHPVNPDVPRLELPNTACPNLVVDLILHEVSYDVPKYRERVSEE